MQISGPTLSSSLYACFSWIKTNMAFLLILATLVLFTSKSLYNIPVAIMALIGLYRFFKSPGQIWQDTVLRMYLILFLCLWLPLLIAFVDTVNFSRSAQTVFPYLRFLFAGVYVIQEIREKRLLEMLNIIIFGIAAFWCIDAMIQYLFGINFFGYPYEPGHITGMFYPKNTIAHVLAALSPLYFESIRIHSKKFRWLWILLIPLFIVILLSGRRAAWIMLAASSLTYTFVFFRAGYFNIQKNIKFVALIVISIIIAVSAVLATNIPLRMRINETVGLFSGDYETIDIATARRLPVWQTSIAIFKDYWANGVGPRAYRYVYQQYSNPDNYFFETGQTHPHQLVLEVLAETGMIGFFGLLLFVFIFYQFINEQGFGVSLCPLWLSVLTAAFPINTHMAFYGSYWASVFWWLIALTFISMSIYIKEK